MSKEKQIEEMANIITDAMINGAENFVDCVVVAVEELVAKGYRKTSEVAREVLALVWDAYQTTHYDAEFEERLDRIEEKYTEESNVTKN